MIGDVFRHNLEDILSLAALAVRLDRVARGPRGPFEEAAVATGLDHLGRPDEALPLYEMSFSRLPTGKVHRGVGRRLANIHRRSGKLERSVEIWRRLWKDGDLRSARNLAIALEHRLGDLRGAERVTRAALEALERGGDATSWSQEDWERRLIRVRRKRERTTRNGAARGGSHHA